MTRTKTTPRQGQDTRARDITDSQSRHRISAPKRDRQYADNEWSSPTLVRLDVAHDWSDRLVARRLGEFETRATVCRPSGNTSMMDTDPCD